jgi:hypothetical protein
MLLTSSFLVVEGSEASSKSNHAEVPEVHTQSLKLVEELRIELTSQPIRDDANLLAMILLLLDVFSCLICFWTLHHSKERKIHERTHLPNFI